MKDIHGYKIIIIKYFKVKIPAKDKCVPIDYTRTQNIKKIINYQYDQSNKYFLIQNKPSLCLHGSDKNALELQAQNTKYVKSIMTSRSLADWQESQRSLTLGLTLPSPGSTTLEDVLDSLLGLPSQPTRVPTPQPSPRKTTSPFYLIGGKVHTRLIAIPSGNSKPITYH